MSLNRTVGELVRISERWATAEFNRDTHFLRDVLTSDFVGVVAPGTTLNKQQWLARCGEYENRDALFNVNGVEVRLYGDVAVVTSREKEEPAVLTGSQIAHVEKFASSTQQSQATLIFVNRAREWKLVGCQLRAQDS